jgi:molybdopterin synthase sulfur carrier subunit
VPSSTPTLSKAITVELYGVPRLRAGRSELIVAAGRLDEVLHAIAAACPELILLADSRLASQYLISVGGKRFTMDPNEMIGPGERLLLLGTDAGG